MTALILQARLDSSRLPNKALLPLGGEPMLLRVMENLRNVRCDSYVLACPPDAELSFAPLAEQAGFTIVIGPKEDVLARYVKAARFIGADTIIRCTGDNPFAFADAARAIAEEVFLVKADYAAYAGLPYGVGVEAVAAEALFRADREAASQAEREHVCPYLYGHPDLFLLHRPAAPLYWQGPDLRLTVDTEADYRRAENLYTALHDPSQTAWASSVSDGQTIIRAARNLDLGASHA